MTPDQLKRTTDDLVSDRNKLSAEAQAATTGTVPPPDGEQPAPQDPQGRGCSSAPAGVALAALAVLVSRRKKR